MAIHLLLKGIVQMREHYRPAESLQDWYEDEVREKYQELRRTRIEVQEIVRGR